MRHEFVRLIATLFAFLIHAQHATARQSLPEAQPAHASEIESLRARLADGAGLNDEQRRQIDAELQKAADLLTQAQGFRQQAEQFERERLATPGEFDRVQAELAKAPESRIDIPDEATLEQLRQQRDQADANLALAQERTTSLAAQETETAGRRQAIVTETARLQQQLQESVTAEQALAAAPAPEPRELHEARVLVLRAQRQMLTQQLAALAAELGRNDARVELARSQRELATRQVGELERAARAWRDAAAREESRLAAEAAAAARRTEAESHPVVREIARRNAELLEMLSGRPGGPQGLYATRDKAQRDHDALAAQLRLLSERLAREIEVGRASGLTEVVDVRLRRMRGALPNLAEHMQSMAHRRVEFSLAQQALADVQYEHDQLPDPQTWLQSVVAGLDPTLGGDTRVEITRQVQQQISRQQELFETLIAEYRSLSELLLDVQQLESRLIQLAERFYTYIDERILWLRSMPALQPGELPRVAGDAKSLFSWENVSDIAMLLWRDARANTSVIALWIVVFLCLFVLKRRLADRLRILAALVPQVYTDRFAHTVRALLITLLLAAFWPGVMWFIAWRLAANAGMADVYAAVASGLNRAGVIAFTLQFHRQLCKPNGLGEAHFRWRHATRRVLRIGLFWLTIVETPLAFIIAAEEAASRDPGTSELGRVSFIAAMTAVACVSAWLLRPRHEVLGYLLSSNGWLQRLRTPVYLGLIALPASLAVTAAMGFYYTALQLEQRLVSTFWLVLILIVFNGLVLRWLMLARRRLAIEEARKRRAAENAASTQPATADGADPTLVLAEPKLDLNAISAQTRQLLRSVIAFTLVLGVWLIWIDLLPALNILKRVELWPEFALRASTDIGPASPVAPAIIDAPPSATTAPSSALPTGPEMLINAAAGGAATDAAADRDTRRVLTLSDLALALLIVLATVVISKNIPGLLEITLLQRLPLEPSGRYAFSTIVRYVVSIVGVVLAFNAMGVGWSQVQWLAAAITLGIGFGLQEIFANFISGIILLFEQPIRVGDTVTVNNIEGTVTRIRMRATTITDYDRKEVVIPNKAFITGQIINWTLSDTIQRLTFHVGVAHGSEVKLVEQTLMEIARTHPLVIADPPPHVVFNRLGDSSLEFALRVYISTLDHFLPVRHEINQRIVERLRGLGVELALPQREVHIRTRGARSKSQEK